jgi:DNA polymerase-3 subunit delta
MIQTLLGKNSYALQTYVRDQIDQVIARAGDFAVERLDASEVEVDTILQAVQSLPFLASEKLVIVTSVQANGLLMDRLDELIDRTAENVHVLLVEPSLDKRKSAFKLLKQKTTLKEFSELDSRLLSQWVRDELKQKDVSISSADASYLVERVGTNQQLIASELDKLTLYGNQITRDVIDKLTEQSLQSTIFELLDAAFSGRHAQAIKLYREQRAARVDPHYILAMLTWQLHAIGVAVHAPARTDQALIAAGIAPYTAKKVLALTQSMSKADYKQIVTALTELDAQIKTSVDADAGIELFLLSL